MININEVRITHELLMDISRLDVMKGMWSNIKEKKESLLPNMKAQTRIASNAASNRIEGGELRDWEVEKAISGITLPNFKAQDVEDARGFVRAISLISDDYELLPFTEETIKRLHREMFKSDEYRKTDKPIQNILFDKGEPLIENAAATEAPRLMRALVDESDTLFSTKSYHPLIITGIFIFHLLNINPFEYGNGRIARLMTTYLLLRNGYSFIEYYPLEVIIEETRKNYLSALKRSQSTKDYGPFLSYFMKSLAKQTIRLESKLNRDDYISIRAGEDDSLSPLESDILEVVRGAKAMYTAELLSSLDYKDPTIKKALRELVKKNKLKQLGVGRGTYYKLGTENEKE